MHNCALASDGTVACWGANSYGESTPPAGTFTQVSAGGDHTCGVRTDGTPVCWGYNNYGQATPPPGTFTQVSAGHSYTCGIKVDGTLACWGYDSYGQARPPAGIYKQVSAGYSSTCALATDLGLACWGTNAIAESPATHDGPALVVAGPYVGDEGMPVALALTGTASATDELTYTWNLGDGTTGSGRTPPTTHTYADNGTYTITLTARDANGGRLTGTTTVTVRNLAPTVSAISAPVDPILVGSPVSVSAAYTDPGTADFTHKTSLHWDDGRLSNSTSGAGPSGTIDASHSYAAAGLYSLHLYVTDKDGGTGEQVFRYIAVYDPAGPYTTGSGSYTTVPSDCPQCGSSQQEADFNFDVRFLAGQSSPDGSVRFWLPATQFDFRSTRVEMLLANLSLVQFWGEGTLNGASGYTFRLTATPGGPGTGAIRMQIWDAGANLVYDVQRHAGRTADLTRAIEGGEIAITQP